MTDIRAEEKVAARPLRVAGRFVRRFWQGIVVVVLAVALGVAAFLSPGLVEADVRLDEGTVYAAKRDAGMVGLVNAQIDEVSDGTVVGDRTFDVLQREDLVLLHGLESDLLSQYFPGRNVVGPPTRLPPNAQLQLVGETLLVVNPANGRVWFGQPEQVLSYDFDEEKAHLEVGENGRATLTTNGDVIGLNVVTSQIVRQGEGGQVATDLPFEFASELPDVQLSAVGDNAVVLDRTGRRVWAEGMEEPFEELGAGRAQLMEPAPDALRGEEGAHAIYANDATLIALTTDGPRSLVDDRFDAAPLTPVQLGECVYAAFGNQFVKRCRGAAAQILEIPEVPEEAELVFEVNRTTVILNDVTSGYIWLVDKDMTLITDWERIIPTDDPTSDENPTLTTELPPDRDEKNQEPVAHDDQFEARKGRSTILPVLDNDYDLDGDVLTISADAQIPGATIQAISGGTGLQITVDQDAPAVLNFSYSIDDGRKGNDNATVTVRVISADPNEDNDAPHLFNDQPIKISRLQSITKRVLNDWRDANGDPMFLRDARLEPGADDILRFTPDGTLTFRDDGKVTGLKKVTLTVSDGTDDREAELMFDVTEDVQPPIAYGDHAVTAIGQTVTILPTVNDLGDEPRLAEANLTTDCPDCSIEISHREDAIKFSAPQEGTYYILYRVTNGMVADGLIRVDVRAEATDHPPIPALDVALLPPGGSVFLDPLLNDSDPDGDVLVIQQISQHPSLEVVLERRHLVTIRAKITPTEPITLTYRVSDGKYTGDCSSGGETPCGTIVIIPTPHNGAVTPAAVDDELRVRAGATGVSQVLRNDTSPLGLDLELTGLGDNPFGDRAWIDGDRIRVSIPAGSAAGDYTLAYEVSDTEGRTANARLNVTVVSEDAQNAPPVPKEIVDRVLAGTVTRIPIDMSDIDPNGDAVRLLGLASGPQRGRVLEVGDDYFTYEAYTANQGTDSFTYRVTDALGEPAVGNIQIGIAPPSLDNAAPTGVMDEVTVRPGRHVQFAPIDNDFDIDGDRIDFAAEDPVEMQTADGEESPIVPALSDSRREIALTAPMEEGSHIGRYYIVDSRGMPGRGSFRVIVEEDAPLLAPVVRDDTVPLATIAQQDWPEIDVLANDYDPDGPIEELTIEVPATNDDPELSARVSDDGRKVIVPLLDRMQQVRYIVVDADDNRSSGIIVVPGRGDAVPVLKDPNVVLDAWAGQPMVLEVQDLVYGTDNRKVKLTGGDNITETFGSAKPASATSIEYVPSVEYQGPASVVFEVADEFEEGEDHDRRAWISVPITVHPAQNAGADDGPDDVEMANQPPQLVVREPTLEVGPGEGEERLDLKPLFKDPEGQQFYIDGELTKVSGDASIDYRLDGSRLIAWASVDATPTESIVLRGTVVDASEGRTTFDIRVQVGVSTRPTITFTDELVVPDAAAGEQVSVNVLAVAQSHLEDPFVELFDNVRVISGDVSRVSTSDGNVLITPASGTHGPVTVVFTVGDATKDPNRRVEGTIRVTVRDKPGAVSIPYQLEPGDGTISLKYDLSHNGGYDPEEVTATVTASSEAGTVTGSCFGQACTVTGLRNGINWTTQVTVTNPRGSSESPVSSGVMPDARPKPPVMGAVAYHDGALSVSWQPGGWESANGGSAITGYTLKLLDTSGNVLGTETFTAAQTSHRWEGLTNGVDYQFTAQAHTSFKDASIDAPPTPPEHPSGPPIGAVVPTVVPVQNEIGGGFTVSFDPTTINANGDPVSEYFVQPVFKDGGSGTMRSIPATSPQGTITVDIQGLGLRETRFLVFAKNRSSVGGNPTGVGGSTDWKIAYPLPKITAVNSQIGDGQVTFSLTANIDHTVHPLYFEYSLVGGAWQRLPANGVVGGLTNGREYSLRFRAVIESMPPSEVASATVRPRSAEPIGPDSRDVSIRLASPRSVTLTIPGSTWESSGGWDPNRFSYCTQEFIEGVTSGCNRFQGERVLSKDVGKSYYFAWGWNIGSDDYVAKSHRPIVVQDVVEPTYRDGTLTFSFPYVESGQCSVTDRANGTHIRTINYSGTGAFAFNGAISYEVEQPPVTPDPSLPPTTPPPVVVVPDNVNVACSVNNWSENF